MPYAKLQFIAYVLNTAPAKGMFNPPPANGAATLKTNPYYPGLPDASQDIENRIALVQRAIDTAAHATNLGGEDTLKIFMLPEFCFRGVTGAYEMDAVDFAIAKLKSLVKDEKYDDWVFVFGSVIGFSRPPVGAADQRLEVYNFSLIQSGGIQFAADSHVVLKEHLSGIDFITIDPNLPVTLPGVPPPDGILYMPKSMVKPGDPVIKSPLLRMGNVRYLDAGGSGAGKESQILAYDGNGIFDCRGIRFGMEICLDHLAARLTASPQIPGDTQVQVQLVPSSGMWIKTASLILDNTGYAFNCDGGSWGASVCRPLAAAAAAVGFKILPVAPTDLKVGTAAAVTIATLYGGGFSPSANAGQGVPPPGNGSEAGNIVAYNPVAAPPRKAVPGKQVSLTWKTNGYQLDFRLFYDGAGKYVCASGQISNPDIDINDLAFILPITLMGTAGDGQSGAIALTVIKGGDGYDLGIKCESTLPGFGSSGLVVEFGKVFGAKAPKKNW